MGYVIQIGEERTWSEDGEPYVGVQIVKNPDSPALLPDEVQTGQANYRIMSGTDMLHFTRETDLAPLLYDGDRRKDGAYAVTGDTLEMIENAIERLFVTHPDAVASPFDKAAPWNYNLHRLLWFRWWLTWALANCERPTMYIG